tara:strand:- start:4349 stop:5617 length:1269 start_codon:yes stop_codon:yes gene_type:complete
MEGGSITFTVAKDILDNLSGGGWIKIAPDDNDNKTTINYHEIEIEFYIRSYKKSSGEYFNSGIKVVKKPDNISKVIISTSVSIINGSRKFKIRSDRDTNGSYYYNNSEQGPFSMDRSTITYQNIISKYLRPNGTIKLVLSFDIYKPEYDINGIMPKLFEMLESSGSGDNKTCERYRNEISNLEKKNKELLEKHEVTELTYLRVQQELIEQREKVDKLVEANKEKEKEALELEKKNKEISQRNNELEIGVSNCKFFEALEKVQPNEVRIDKFDNSSILESLQKLMIIQDMLQKEMKVANACKKCRMNPRQCAMAPCGHLAYCLKCYEEEKVKLQKVMLQKENTDKEAEISENKEIELTDFEKKEILEANDKDEDEDLDDTEIFHEALEKKRKETLSNKRKEKEKIMTCPICDKDVAKVINVMI